MRIVAVVISLLVLVGITTPCRAQEVVKPESIVEKMSFKFARGLANVATSIVELPKQTYLTVRDRGGVGYVIGPLKGIGMTVYRAVMGGVETIFFMVPQPGYFDPMVDPEFVWKGWEPKRPEPVKAQLPEQDTPSEKKGD